MNGLKKRNPGESEFHQAVHEPATSVMPASSENPEYERAHGPPRRDQAWRARLRRRDMPGLGRSPHGHRDPAVFAPRLGLAAGGDLDALEVGTGHAVGLLALGAGPVADLRLVDREVAVPAAEARRRFGEEQE